MSRVTYDAGTMTITVDGLEDVERALGDLKKKTPAAAKVAINATARQARKLMVAQAKARYAVNAAGRRHLKDLVQRKKATNTSLSAELHIEKMRNDLGYGEKLYRCVQQHTSQAGWEPDKAASLWSVAADPAEEWPEWSQPLGAHDAYAKGAKVSHNGKHWVSDLDANVWEPGVSGWSEAKE